MAKSLRSVGTFLTNHPGANPLLLCLVESLTRCLKLGETTLNVSKLKATNKEQKFFRINTRENGSKATDNHKSLRACKLLVSFSLIQK